jgi:hypothetical protein
VKIEWSWIELLATVRTKIDGGLFHEQISCRSAGLGERACVVRRVVVSDASASAASLRSVTTRIERRCLAPALPGTCIVVRSISLSIYDPAGSSRRASASTPAATPPAIRWMRFVLWKVYARLAAAGGAQCRSGPSASRGTAQFHHGRGRRGRGGAARVAVEAGARSAPSWCSAPTATRATRPMSARRRWSFWRDRLRRRRRSTAAGLGPFLSNVR